MIKPELNCEYPEPGEAKLAEHRPMGGINRMRQAVYAASQVVRTAHS